MPGKENNGFRITDHRYLNLKINIHNLKRGSGYWKLNTQYLEDSKYKAGIKSIIENLENDDPITKWETFKLKVKEFSIKYSKTSLNEERMKTNKLEKELENIETGNSININMNRRKKRKNSINYMKIRQKERKFDQRQSG